MSEHPVCAAKGCGAGFDGRCVTCGEPIVRDENSLGWHTISGVHLLETLKRVQAGEDADSVYMELWANAEHENFRDDD